MEPGRHNAQFPVDESEYLFARAEPEIEFNDPLEAKVISDEFGATFSCRDCGEIQDIDYCLGCDCFVCERCAMSYLADLA